MCFLSGVEWQWYGCKPGGPRLELVGELVARLDDLEDAVHVRRVDAVEVDRVRVRAGVREADAQDVALGRAQHRAGDGAVVRPGREEDARRDLDLAVDRGQRVLAHAAGLRGQRRRRVEQRVEVVRAADGRRAVADHRRVAHRASARRLAAAGAGASRGRARRPPRSAPNASFSTMRRRRDRSGRREQPAPRESFSHG